MDKRALSFRRVTMTGNKRQVNLLVTAALNRCARLEKSSCSFTPLHPSTSQNAEMKQKMSEKKNLRSNRINNEKAPMFLRPIRLTLLVLASIGLLGTIYFCSYEDSEESKVDLDTYARLNDAIKTIADDLQITARTEDEREMEESVKNAYIKLLEIEGKWPASEKTRKADAHYIWTVAAAFLFTLTSVIAFVYLFRSLLSPFKLMRVR